MDEAENIRKSTEAIGKVTISAAVTGAKVAAMGINIALLGAKLATAAAHIATDVAKGVEAAEAEQKKRLLAEAFLHKDKKGIMEHQTVISPYARPFPKD